MTRVAASRPDSDNLRSRSSLTASNPSRSIRATVWDTVGPEWPKRSAIRARIGGIPSSPGKEMKAWQRRSRPCPSGPGSGSWSRPGP